MTSTKKGAPSRHQGHQGDQSVGGTEGSASMLPRRTDNPLRRRRAASLRLPPLADGFRDPLDRSARTGEPSTYGMNETELRRYANHLVLHEGWSPWEVRQRLAIAPRPQCCPCCQHHHQEAAA